VRPPTRTCGTHCRGTSPGRCSEQATCLCEQQRVQPVIVCFLQFRQCDIHCYDTCTAFSAE
jgi:hypothetical protein